MENIKALGKTACEVLLNENNASSEAKTSFEKQQLAVKALRELPKEEQDQLLSSTSVSQLTVKSLLKIDAVRELVVVADSNHENNSNNSKTFVSRIVSDARATCLIHRLPRPGTENFFATQQANSNTKISGQRRQREEQQHQQEPTDDAGSTENKTEKENFGILLQRQMFGVDRPLVDGVTFISLLTGVAHSLKKNGKFNKLLENKNIHLSSSKKEKEEKEEDDGDHASYRVAHVITTLLLNIMRRIQCYSQCQFDLQSKLSSSTSSTTCFIKKGEEQGMIDVKKEEEEQDIAPSSLSSSSTASCPCSVSFVRRALMKTTSRHGNTNPTSNNSTTTIMSQKQAVLSSSQNSSSSNKNNKMMMPQTRKMTLQQEAEAFLTISNDPTKAQRTFFQPNVEDKVVEIGDKTNNITANTKHSKNNRNLKMIGKLEGTRLAVSAALDSVK